MKTYRAIEYEYYTSEDKEDDELILRLKAEGEEIMSIEYKDYEEMRREIERRMKERMREMEEGEYERIRGYCVLYVEIYCEMVYNKKRDRNKYEEMKRGVINMERYIKERKRDLYR